MWAQIEHRSDAIRCFHPAWFASVMGTGIIAVATHHADKVLPGLEGFAVVLWVLSAVFFVALIVPWTIRWIRYPREAWADTAHPTRGPFYSTMPIALLVLAVDFAAIGSTHMNADTALSIAKGLWIVGTLLAFFFGVLVPSRWLTGSASLEHINGGMVHPSGCRHRRSRRCRAADLLVGIARHVRVRLRCRIRVLRDRDHAVHHARRAADRPTDPERASRSAPRPNAVDRPRADRRREPRARAAGDHGNAAVRRIRTRGADAAAASLPSPSGDLGCGGSRPRSCSRSATYAHHSRSR